MNCNWRHGIASRGKRQVELLLGCFEILPPLRKNGETILSIVTRTFSQFVLVFVIVARSWCMTFFPRPILWRVHTCMVLFLLD
jgi:hypothetical protein